MITKAKNQNLLITPIQDGPGIAVSFISDQAFFLGTAIVIKIAHSKLKDSCNNDLEKLPGMRIGEVKWCKKLPVEASTAYEVGIKYYYKGY